MSLLQMFQWRNREWYGYKCLVYKTTTTNQPNKKRSINRMHFVRNMFYVKNLIDSRMKIPYFIYQTPSDPYDTYPSKENGHIAINDENNAELSSTESIQFPNKTTTYNKEFHRNAFIHERLIKQRPRLRNRRYLRVIHSSRHRIQMP